MNYKEEEARSIQKMLQALEYQDDIARCRRDFLTKGIKFFDEKGWGWLRNGVKHYQQGDFNE